jgi:hypothetical protein
LDWSDFARRLTVELMWLPERSFLIVQGETGLPYVQALRTQDTLEAEAVGSAFLPEPLAPQQERRLTVNGWERPGDPDTENWWSRVTMNERNGRPVPDQAERCAALALRMVAAFRDAYDVPSPDELVYHAGDGHTGEPLELPGLGIPREDQIGEDRGGVENGAADAPSLTGAALENALAAARQRGDQDAYLELLSRAVLYLPSPADPTYDDGTGNQYATARFGDETFVLAFTSPETMDRSLRGQAVHHRETFLPELAVDWPHPAWQLAVNPGLPSAGYLDAASLPRPGEPVAGGEGAATAPDAPPVSVPAPGTQDAVMQKVISPGQVAHYLEGGYDLVAGYVHLLRDVRDLDTPEKVVRGLGLVYDGSPFQPVGEAVHVIRWPAHKPALFRRPLGGTDERSMGAVPGGWVIEKAPFPGSGHAPGEGPEIPEFKIDSQRLPHGAEMYRLDRSGRETLIGGWDADLRRWLLAPGARSDAPADVHPETRTDARADAAADAHPDAAPGERSSDGRAAKKDKRKNDRKAAEGVKDGGRG